MEYLGSKLYEASLGSLYTQVDGESNLGLPQGGLSGEPRHEVSSYVAENKLGDAKHGDRFVVHVRISDVHDRLICRGFDVDQPTTERRQKSRRACERAY